MSGVETGGENAQSGQGAFFEAVLHRMLASLPATSHQADAGASSSVPSAQKTSQLLNLLSDHRPLTQVSVLASKWCGALTRLMQSRQSTYAKLGATLVSESVLQVHPDLLLKFAIPWSTQLLSLLRSNSPIICQVACESSGVLMWRCGQFAALKRDLAKDHKVTAFVMRIVKATRDGEFDAVVSLRALVRFLLGYPSAVKEKASPIFHLCASFLTSEDFTLQKLAAECISLLPLTGHTQLSVRVLTTRCIDSVQLIANRYFSLPANPAYPIKAESFLLSNDLLREDAFLHYPLEYGLRGVFLTLHALFGQSYAHAVSLPVDRLLATLTALLDLDPFTYRLSRKSSSRHLNHQTFLANVHTETYALLNTILLSVRIHLLPYAGQIGDILARALLDYHQPPCEYLMNEQSLEQLLKCFVGAFEVFGAAIGQSLGDRCISILLELIQPSTQRVAASILQQKTSTKRKEVGGRKGKRRRHQPQVASIGEELITEEDEDEENNVSDCANRYSAYVRCTALDALCSIVFHASTSINEKKRTAIERVCVALLQQCSRSLSLRTSFAQPTSACSTLSVNSGLAASSCVSLLPSCAPEHLFGDSSYRLALLRLGRAFLLSPCTSQPPSLPFLVAAFRSGLNDCAQEVRRFSAEALRICMLYAHPRAPPVQRRVDDREAMLQSVVVGECLDAVPLAPVVVHSSQLPAPRTLVISPESGSSVCASSSSFSSSSSSSSSSSVSSSELSLYETQDVIRQERDRQQAAALAGAIDGELQPQSSGSVHRGQAFAGMDDVVLGKRVRSLTEESVEIHQQESSTIDETQASLQSDAKQKSVAATSSSLPGSHLSDEDQTGIAKKKLREDHTDLAAESSVAATSSTSSPASSSFTATTTGNSLSRNVDESAQLSVPVSASVPPVHSMFSNGNDSEDDDETDLLDLPTIVDEEPDDEDM